MPEGRGNGLGFAKKVVIVSGAVLSVAALGNTLGALAMKALVVPEIERIMVEERKARSEADTKLSIAIQRNTRAIAQLSEDRVLILSIMGTNSDRARTRAMEELRERWEREQLWYQRDDEGR